MKLIRTQKTDGTPFNRLQVTKTEAISLARELLEIVEGNGRNAFGNESTHWVVSGDINRGDEVHFCFWVEEMKRRYQLISKKRMIAVDAEFTPSGREFLEGFRRSHSEFRGARIRDVLQAYPSRVPLRRAYRLHLPLKK